MEITIRLQDSLPRGERLRLEHLTHRILRRFSKLISRVELRLADLNGPKGGEDKECLVSLRGADGRHSVCVSHSSGSFIESTSWALKRASHALIKDRAKLLAKQRGRAGRAL